MATATTYDERVLEQARGLGTSTLYEASGISTAAVDSNIRTAWPGASIAGPAFPLECSPGDNLSIHIAMERVPRGTLAAARSVYPFAAHLMQ
jgi:4-hydroxy-4-methyl-2-oxoglutarate aldolase